MLLSDHDILQLWIASEGKLIEPWDEALLQPASYDLRLGSQLLIDDPSGYRSYVTLDTDFHIYRTGVILGTTVETVRVPHTHAARVEGKSTHARRGLMVHLTAGWIDPGFEGQITLEMACLSNSGVVIRPGEPICQISFYELKTPSTRPYSGKYQGQRGPQEAL